METLVERGGNVNEPGGLIPDRVDLAKRLQIVKERKRIGRLGRNSLWAE